MLSASEDEKASCRSIPGWWARRASLLASLHITPEEIMATRLDRSQRSGSASRARSIGLAKASPTMAIMLTPSRSTVSSSSTASNERAGQGDHAAPGHHRHEGGEPAGAVHERAGGHVHGPGPGERLAHEVEVHLLAVLGGDGVGVRQEQVVLAPHDALGHAGRAARVEHEEVVAVPAPVGHGAVGGQGGGVLVGRGPVGTGPGPVVHPQPRAHRAPGPEPRRPSRRRCRGRRRRRRRRCPTGRPARQPCSGSWC